MVSILALACSIFIVLTRRSEDEKLVYVALSVLAIAVLVAFVISILQKRKANSVHSVGNLPVSYDVVQSIAQATEEVSQAYNELDGYLENGTLTDEVLRIRLETTSRQICDRIADIFLNYTGKKICVHIKHFPPHSSTDTGENDTKLTTLAAMSTFDRKRFRTHEHPLRKNTHINQMVTRRKQFFFTNDWSDHLREYNEDHPLSKFETSTTMASKWYKSLIMVPIVTTNNNTPTYLGFILCDFPQKKRISSRTSGLISTNLGNIFEYFLFILCAVSKMLY